MLITAILFINVCAPAVTHSVHRGGGLPDRDPLDRDPLSPNRDPPQDRDPSPKKTPSYGYEWVVCILLECILVKSLVTCKKFSTPKRANRERHRIGIIWTGGGGSTGQSMQYLDLNPTYTGCSENLKVSSSVIRKQFILIILLISFNDPSFNRFT